MISAIFQLCFFLLESKQRYVVDKFQPLTNAIFCGVVRRAFVEKLCDPTAAAFSPKRAFLYRQIGFWFLYCLISLNVASKALFHTAVTDFDEDYQELKIHPPHIAIHHTPLIANERTKEIY